MNFFRVQEAGLTLDQMQEHTSADGGDGMIEHGGICACDSVDDLMDNTAMGAANNDDEIVVFKGIALCEIYDGYRVRPISEVARMTVVEFVDNPPYELEEW